jgi:hypothetical protein
MSQAQRVSDLVKTLQASPATLEYARNIATAIVSGPHNHCAATLSALLVFAGIYPNGGGTGSGDLEPWVPSLAFDLEKRRGWTRVPVGPEIAKGDVGVVLASATTHHIYLVVDPADPADPLIADNQGLGMHRRPVVGDPVQSYSPTNFFLRPPA